MNVHLVTLVGGYVDVLPAMLKHYRAAGVDAFTVNVQMNDADDPTLDAVRAATTRFGCEVASVAVGQWQSLQGRVWRASMRSHANDWCVLADQDELHLYPDRLSSLLEYCDRKGYDYIRGAFVDRIGADGRFPAVDASMPLWPQFPLGGFITFPMLGADPRKVVAARGNVRLAIGQHVALNGVGCPIEDVFVQVHHFKWTAGLIDRLVQRAAALRRQRVSHWVESDRFVRYYEQHGGRVDLGDPRFLIGPCEPEYPHWRVITAMASRQQALVGGDLLAVPRSRLGGHRIPTSTNAVHPTFRAKELI